MSRETLIGIAVAIIGYQLFVTVRIVFSRRYSALQRSLQVAIIWLVPLFGAILCHMFVDTDTGSPGIRDTSFTPAAGDNPTGIGQGGEH